MEKRGIILGDYNTAVGYTFGWTLTAWQLSAAKRKENLVDKPGGHGHWDLSTVLTDGEPVYEARTLTATLECSEGDRFSRETEISVMINELDGRTMNIVIPDRTGSYLTGVVHVERLYNDLAHASVALTVICDPWLYSMTDRSVSLTASSTEKTTALYNSGRLSVVPLLEISGGTVSLTFGEESWALAAGSYKLPGFRLTSGENQLTYSGSGKIKITYREAVL